MQICNAPHAETSSTERISSVESEAQWSMDDNVIGRPVWNRMFLILTDDERSKRRGMAMAILDERCEGLSDWRITYVSVATLKSVFHLIGNRLWSIAEMLDQPCWRVTTRPSVFWIRSSLCRTEVEAPINRICLVQATADRWASDHLGDIFCDWRADVAESTDMVVTWFSMFTDRAVFWHFILGL